MPLRPPKGAPNVLVVLIDDVGFGASSAFGGPCATSNFKRLAAEGLKYTRFHTTALCSPTLGAADRAQPPLRRHGQHRRAGDVGAGQQLDLAQHGRAAGEDAAAQRLQHSAVREAFLFSADETCDVGNEFGSPVTTDYATRKFTGEVSWVEIDLGLDDHNHLIAAEDRINLAMAFQ